MNESEVRPIIEEQPAQNESRIEETATQPLKKPFVEPTISVSVDVLEATTYFFQFPVDSGSL